MITMRYLLEILGVAVFATSGALAAVLWGLCLPVFQLRDGGGSK